MAAISNRFIVILCGGSGPRLWPLSRASHPKQFLPLLSNQSLYQETLSRALKLVPAKNVFVVSNFAYQHQVYAQSGNLLPRANYLFEPEKKNTCLAMLFAAATITKLNPNATITHFASDHYIAHLSRFAKDVQLSWKIAEALTCLVTVGTIPTFPNPGYGYITTQKIPSKRYHKVTRFIEKPDIQTAEQLINKGAFWHANMYTWTVPTLVQELNKHSPNYSRLYTKLVSANSASSLKKVYAASPALSIDKALAEQTNNLYLLPASFGWSDVGEWGLLWRSLVKNPTNNLAFGKANTIFQDSLSCSVHNHSGQLVALVGLKDTAVVTTKDAVLVCSHAQSYLVRKLIATITGSKKYITYFLRTPSD